MAKILALAISRDDLGLEVELARTQICNMPTVLDNVLHAAIIGQPVPMVVMLLASGAAIDFVSPNLQTPLHRAAGVPGGEEIVEGLLNHEAALLARDANGGMPLHHAAQKGL